MSAPESAQNLLGGRRCLPLTVTGRIVDFLEPGRYGRIELDVVDGRVVALRVHETFKIRDDDELVLLRETG